MQLDFYSKPRWRMPKAAECHLGRAPRRPRNRTGSRQAGRGPTLLKIPSATTVPARPPRCHLLTRLGSATRYSNFFPTFTFFLFNIFLLVSKIINSQFISIQSSLLSVFDLIMLDSWIDEVHESASWFCVSLSFSLT